MVFADLCRTLQPRGSGPVIVDVWIRGGEEDDDVVEDREGFCAIIPKAGQE